MKPKTSGQPSTPPRASRRRGAPPSAAGTTPDAEAKRRALADKLHALGIQKAARIATAKAEAERMLTAEARWQLVGMAGRAVEASSDEDDAACPTALSDFVRVAYSTLRNLGALRKRYAIGSKADRRKVVNALVVGLRRANHPVWVFLNQFVVWDHDRRTLRFDALLELRRAFASQLAQSTGSRGAPRVVAG